MGGRSAHRTVMADGPLSDCGGPFPDAPLQDTQRHRALAQDLMELLDVESGTEALLRLVAGAHPGRMSNLVAAGLADHRAVALDLPLRAGAGVAGRLDHVIGRLLAAPSLGMDPGVDDQTRGAEQERLEITGAAERIVRIDAELIGDLLGIKRPTLRVGGEAAGLAQQRDVLGLLGDADLQVMARHALMVTEGRQRIFRPVAEILEVDEVYRGPGVIESR